MLNYQKWKMLNETLRPINLGLTNPTNLGLSASQFNLDEKKHNPNMDEEEEEEEEEDEEDEDEDEEDEEKEDKKPKKSSKKKRKLKEATIRRKFKTWKLKPTN